jgi:hypothetical protein
MRSRRTRPRALRLLCRPKAALGLEPHWQRVLVAAARDVARELGRHAAREHFEMLIRRNNERAS